MGERTNVSVPASSNLSSLVKPLLASQWVVSFPIAFLLVSHNHVMCVTNLGCLCGDTWQVALLQVNVKLQTWVQKNQQPSCSLGETGVTGQK